MILEKPIFWTMPTFAGNHRLIGLELLASIDFRLITVISSLTKNGDHTKYKHQKVNNLKLSTKRNIDHLNKRLFHRSQPL